MEITATGIANKSSSGEILDIFFPCIESIDKKVVNELFDKAEEIADNSVSLHEFTRTLHETLNDEAKNEIIEMLWRLALVDDSLDRYEDYLVRKIADLLYVSNSNVLRIKHELTSN